MKKIILLLLLTFPLSAFFGISFVNSIVAQNPELIIPVGHKEIVGIYDIDVSSDHKLVATVAGKVAKIWNYQTGRLLKNFEYNGYGFSRAKFTPDGKKLLLTCEDTRYQKHILILNSDTYDIVNEVSGDVKTWCLAISPDSQTAFSVSMDKSQITKIDLKTGTVTPFYTMQDGTGTVNLSLSPDGKRLLAMFSKGKFNGEPFESVILPTGGGAEKILTQNVQYQYFTPKGNLFSLSAIKDETKGTKTYTFTWSDPNTLKEITHKSLISNGIYSSYSAESMVNRYDFFSNSDKILFTVGEKVWTIAPNQEPELHTFTDPRNGGKSLNPKSKYLQIVSENEFIVGTENNFIYRYDLKNKQLLTEYGISVFAPKEIRASATGKAFAVAGYDEKPFLLSWEGGRTHIKQFSDAKNKVYFVRETAANVSPDGSIAAYCTDYNLKVVDSRNGSTILNTYNHNKGHHLEISPNNNLIVVSGDDQTVSLINRKTGVMKEIGKGDFTEGVFSADNNYFLGLQVTGKNETIVSYFDVANGKKLWEKRDDEHLLGNHPFIFDGNEVGFVSLRDKKYVFLKTTDGSISREENGDSYHFIGKTLLETQMQYEEWIKKTTNKDFWHSKIVENGSFYIQSHDNNTLQVFRTKSGEKLADIILSAENGDWAVITPEGLFDASEVMMKSLYYTKGKQIIPLEALSEKFYTPNLLAQIFSKTDEPEPKKEDIKKIKSPPSVKIGVPSNQRNLVVEDDSPAARRYNMSFEKISLTIEATCPEDGVSEIRLYHNGKLVGNGTRNLVVEDDKPETSKSQKFDIQLVEGENSFKAIALNTQRTESQPDEIIVNYKAAKASAPSEVGGTEGGITLHLMVIGINKYKNPKYNLNYATADATSFKEAIEKGGSTIFNKTNVIFIGDDKATKEGISTELEKVKAAANPQDVFIFYYAGHGVLNDKKEFFLVPHDVIQLYGNNDALAQKGLSANQLQQFSKDIKAQKQLFILDACQSAGALDQIVAARGAAEEKAIAQLARATGTHWLTASGSEQFASEFQQLGHGTFTYVLLEALSGKADKGGDKKVTVKELDAYLQEQVPEMTAKYKGTPQYPASYGYGNDFPIGVVKQ